MADEIQRTHSNTTDTLYFTISQPETQEIWDVAAGAWTSGGSASADQGDYDIPLDNTTGDANDRRYFADFPTGITTAAFYTVELWKQSGANPDGDLDMVIATRVLEWNGTAEVSGITGLVAGGVAFTYTVYEPGGVTPIAGATVWVTSDQAGSNVVANGTTDASGEIAVTLPAATYYFWSRMEGYNFTNPDSHGVS